MSVNKNHKTVYTYFLLNLYISFLNIYIEYKIGKKVIYIYIEYKIGEKSKISNYSILTQFIMYNYQCSRALVGTHLGFKKWVQANKKS